MKHDARIFGGYDYDVYVRCTCGAYVLESSDEISVDDIKLAMRTHADSLEVDNV